MQTEKQLPSFPEVTPVPTQGDGRAKVQVTPGVQSSGQEHQPQGHQGPGPMESLWQQSVWLFLQPHQGPRVSQGSHPREESDKHRFLEMTLHCSAA